MRNTTLDPVTGEAIETSTLDIEEGDTNADPENVEARAEAQVFKPQLIPSYIEVDFEFRRGYKDQDIKKLLVEGKRAYFLQPRTIAVNDAITDAGLAVIAAFQSVKPDDIK